jgi:hypothetical protein
VISWNAFSRRQMKIRKTEDKKPEKIVERENKKKQ